MVNPRDPVMGARRGGWFASARAAMLHIRAQGGNKTAQAELDQWLPRAADHQDAYHDAAKLWDDLGDMFEAREAAHMAGHSSGHISGQGSTSFVAPARPRAQRHKRSARPRSAVPLITAPVWAASTRTASAKFIASAALLLLVSLIGLQWYNSPAVYQTPVGGQQVIMLADTTRVTLNTGSELLVYRMGKTRRATLVRGEALFDVAHDADHPFIVKAGKRSVIVRGTSFVVRNDPQNFNVSLITGRVEVAYNDKVVTLQPGQRYRATPGTSGAIDRPQLAMVTAWRKGELMLDNMRVGDAVAEMNRYSAKPIIIRSPALANQRISGVFRTGESAMFANTIATLYGAPLNDSARAWTLGSTGAQ